MEPSGNEPSTTIDKAAKITADGELPRWLISKTKIALRHFWRAIRGHDYRLLAQFSHDFGTCLRSSGDVERGLDLCLKPIRRTPIGKHWQESVEKLHAGSTLAEALAPAKEFLPCFYLPVVAAGEDSGRLVESFEYLERHCRLLAGPASTLRNLWAYPLAILILGSVLKVLITFFAGSLLATLSTFFAELFSWLQLALLITIVIISPARYFIERLRLSLPIIGELDREIALHRFFRVMALVYSVGEHRVERMIQTAAQTVGNRAARTDLLKAADAIENQATISEAFRKVPILRQKDFGSIKVGEESGTLEKTFDQIADETGASLIAKINYVQPILVRIVMALVVFSLLTTLIRLAV